MLVSALPRCVIKLCCGPTMRDGVLNVHFMRFKLGEIDINEAKAIIVTVKHLFGQNNGTAPFKAAGSTLHFQPPLALRHASDLVQHDGRIDAEQHRQHHQYHATNAAADRKAATTP